MKRLLFSLLFVLLSLFITTKILAQQGCCSYHGGVSGCDSSVGRKVCNDGTYSPTCVCYREPQVIQPPDFPQNIQAMFSYIPNTAGGYTVIAELTDKNPTRYSAVLSNVAGTDPGPLVDFNGGVFTYSNIIPGDYYLNVKQDINGVWSKIVYWKTSVPEWVSVTPTNTLMPTLAVDTSTNNKSLISSFFEWLFSSFKSKNTTTPAPISEQSVYTCNCAKTCTQISTCEEAYYQLDTCGCSVRDGDNDGIPCENLCL